MYCTLYSTSSKTTNTQPIPLPSPLLAAYSSSVAVAPRSTAETRRDTSVYVNDTDTHSHWPRLFSEEDTAEI